MSQTSDLSPAKSLAKSTVRPPGDSSLDQRFGGPQVDSVEDSEAAPANEAANSNLVAREQPLHRQVFLDTNPGSPWDCTFCGEPIAAEELHVHHRDNDHSNNDPDNLAPTHADCHAHHHRTGLEKFDRPPAATRLRIAAGALDDVEKLRMALQNQERGLRAHRLLDEEAEKLLAIQLEHVKVIENKAVLALKRAVRDHPLADWIQETPGISEKGIGRLLAAIGEPAYNAAEDRPRRGPAELWAYCGYAPGQKRRRGQKANWNAEAKMRAYVVAETVVKVGGPYREVYDEAKASWADRDTSDGHKHNHALRIVAKTILRDIFVRSIRVTTTIGPAAAH